ncbi:phospholipase-like protein [Tanacetum coccineum]
MSTLTQFTLACNSIVLKEVLAVMFENDNEHDFNLLIDMHTKLNDLGMRIRHRAELILAVEKQGYSAEVFETVKLLKDLQETDNAKVRFGFLNLSKAALIGGIGTPKSYQRDWLGRRSNCLKDLIIDSQVNLDLTPTILEQQTVWCDTTRVEEIRLKDGVIAKLNSRVLGRERKGVSLLRLQQEEDERCRLEEHKRMEALFLKTLQEEVQMCDKKQKMLKYEEEKKKRRHDLMNSDHWKLVVSKISNGKRTQRSSAFSAYYWGNTFAMAEKDRPLNSLNDQDMNLFLKDVTPWVEDLSRYNRATDRVHLTDAFDIFLGRQGPLRCRFPWRKDVSVDRRFWESLVCLDPTNKGWIMDEHVELWVNYMWHFRPHDADWAMVGVYFVHLLLQDSILSWYADGTLYKVSWCGVEEVFMPINETDQHWCLAHLHNRTGLVTFYESGLTYDPEWRECCVNMRMIVSVPTPYYSRLLGFNMDEEPIIEVDDIGYQMDTTLHPGTDDRGCGYFMWMDDFRSRISSSGPSTPPMQYTCPSTRPSYSAGTSRSAMNVRKAECSNCKFLAEKIKTLEAKIKILDGTLDIERHLENHTIKSAAILHELYNDMGKLCLEIDMEAALEEEMLNLFTRFLERIRLRSPEISRLGSQPDNPLVDHGRELLERLTGADMRNAMQMMRARHELQRNMAEKVVMITNYRKM